jgi:hypothetical protein
VFPTTGVVVLAKFSVTLKLPVVPDLLPKLVTVISVFVVFKINPAGSAGETVTVSGRLATTPEPP